MDPVNNDPNANSVAIINTATEHINHLATLAGPLSSAQCQALQELINASQQVFSEKCTIVQ